MRVENIYKTILILCLLTPAFVSAEAMKCYTKNEVGEMSAGKSHIFERTDDLDKSKPAIMNFNELKIINATTGTFSSMIKKSDNHFMSGKYHYITNNEKTVAVEITFSKSDGVDLVFSKILMCERY